MKEGLSLGSLDLECALKSFTQVCLSEKKILKVGVSHLGLVVMGTQESGGPEQTAIWGSGWGGLPAAPLSYSTGQPRWH